MARFVDIGNLGKIINVDQVVNVVPTEKKDRYIVYMSDGSDYDVTHDELLEITGQQGHRESDKKYAIKVFSGYYPVHFVDRYLVFNRETSIPLISSDDSDSKWQAHFTKEEIEALKNRDDIAIDWDKVELEEVEDE